MASVSLLSGKRWERGSRSRNLPRPGTGGDYRSEWIEDRGLLGMDFRGGHRARIQAFAAAVAPVLPAREGVVVARGRIGDVALVRVPGRHRHLRRHGTRVVVSPADRTADDVGRNASAH